MPEYDNPYVISYLSVPLAHLKAMWAMRGIIEQAVTSGIHRRSEADLRVSALAEALKIQEKRD